MGNEQSETLTVYISAVNVEKLGIKDIDMSTQKGAGEAISQIKEAINLVSTQRAELGAYQNRLEHVIFNLDNVVENTQAAESRIRDADMAKEMVDWSNQKILRQTGQAMLANTKQSKNGVLMLLQA